MAPAARLENLKRNLKYGVSRVQRILRSVTAKARKGSDSPVTVMSSLFALGSSRHGSFKPVAVMRKITTGTSMDTRQTVFVAMPELNMGLDNDWTVLTS